MNINCTNTLRQMHGAAWNSVWMPIDRDGGYFL